MTTLAHLIERVENYTPTSDMEKTHRLVTLHHLRHTPDVLFRHQCTPGHATASAFITNPQRTALLLIKHKTIGHWTMPGGHLDGSADILAEALREVWEETSFGASSFTVPPSFFDLDVHHVSANAEKNEPVHIHFDFRFEFILHHEGELPLSPEDMPMRWFSVEECQQMFPASGGRYRGLQKIIAAR